MESRLTGQDMAFDPASEAAQAGPAKHAIISTVGYVRGEGLAVLSANA